MDYLEYISSSLAFVASFVAFLFTVIHYRIFKQLIAIPTLMLIASFITFFGGEYHEMCLITHNTAFIVTLVYLLIGRITLTKD